jgi:tetratricopeptide (TPR) repeat protein
MTFKPFASALLALAAAIPAGAQDEPAVRRPHPLPPLPPPSMRLADTNATPMQTRELSVDATVRGLYATVETTLVFHNPNGRILEGELVFPLPDGAAVCGYALDIDGRLVDGVVVPKEKARVAFETETRRNVDPGLVEHVKGNLYKTRIYPLPAGGDRTVRLAYTTPLAFAPDGSAALSLPMPRTPLARRSVAIDVVRAGETPPVLGGLGDASFAPVESRWHVEKAEEDVTPADDLLVALPALPAQTAALEKDADGAVWFALSDLVPAAKADAKDAPAAPAARTVLWDASASRADADLEKEYALLSALDDVFPRVARRKTPAPPWTMVVFRNEPEPPRTFYSAEALIAALKDVPYDGGTDFARLAAALPPAAANGTAPALLFTDGLDTLSGAPLAFAAAAVKPVAVVSQTEADRESLRQACAGRLLDLQLLTPDQAVAALAAPARTVAGLEGTGLAQVQGIGQPATGIVRILGQLTAPEAEVRIRYSDGTLSAPYALRAADARDGTVLATAWAASRVRQLSPRADDHAEELLALGRRHGLVSPATSLIVLDTLDQWVRHGIEPPESLPEMRAEYNRIVLAKISRDPADEIEAHKQKLSDLWKDRVAWWKDYKKTLPKEPKREPRGLLGHVRNAFGSNARLASAPVDGMPNPEAAGDVMYEMDEAPAMMRMAAAEAEPMPARSAARAPAAKASGAAASSAPRESAIAIKPWSPDTPYLKAIRKAAPDAADAPARYTAYLAQRAEWSSSPAFYLDCADAFLKDGHAAYGIRILTNLAELRIEDVPLLRVLAWRLQQAGELDAAIVQLRRIAKLRAEEPQSFRDLALALAERGRRDRTPADVAEALELFQKVAFTPWARHADSIPLFALEEFNALAAWAKSQTWPDGAAPAIPSIPKEFRQNLDTDLRIVMSWDADATDVDLHVVEPSGEEAYYAHNRTKKGGLVSRDITDGYGPEEYLIKKALDGPYAVKAHYFGSRQQTVTGPATVTATVFTDWGRPTQTQQVLTLRLEKTKDTVEVGTIRFGKEAPSAPSSTNPFTTLRPGMTRDEVAAALSPLLPGDDGLYHLSSTSYRIEYTEDGLLLRVLSLLPSGEQTLLVQ